MQDIGGAGNGTGSATGGAGPALADTPGALTAAWLTEVLTAAGTLDGAEVVAVEARPLGTGQMGDSVRLSLTYGGATDAPATLVAKLPASDPTSRATAVALANYVKEVAFYRELASSLPVHTPRIHHLDIDQTGGRFVLLMEDLAPAVQGDQLAGCSPEVAAGAVSQLVGLHAPRWGDPTLHDLAWLHSDPADRRAGLGALLPPLWDGFRDRYRSELSDTVLRAGGALFDVLDHYLTPPRGLPDTVVHGDFRLDNLLLGADPADVTVVDWQTVATGQALGDLAYFLGASLLPDDRRDHERGLVGRYHRELGRAGVDLDWDLCWHGYRRGSWSGLVMAVAASMLVERTERGDRMFLVMAERHAIQATDLDAIAAI